MGGGGMLRWFNHIRFFLYVGALVVWFAVFLLLISVTKTIPSLPGYLIPVLVLCVLYIFSSFWVSKEANETVSRYNNQCDPQPMLDICTAQLSEMHSAPTQRYMLFLRGNRIAALSALGRTEEAAAEMEWFLPKIPEKRGKPTLFTVLNRLNYVGIMLDQGRIDRSVRELSSLTDLLASPDCPAAIRPLLARHLELHRCALALLRGDYQGGLLEGRLLSLLDSAPYFVSRVGCAYQLGKYYLATDRRDEAMERFQYVADNGGTLAICANAKQFLLDGKDPSP